MAKLFGFSIDDSDNKPDSVVSPVPRSNEDGVDYFVQSGFYGQYVDIEGIYKNDLDSWNVDYNDLDMLTDQSFTKGRMDNNIVDLNSSDVKEILKSIL